jgi:predicted transcriptional regulator
MAVALAGTRSEARTTTVRVTNETHGSLRELAEELQQPISQVLAAAVEHYRRWVFLEKVNEEYARLWADPVAWAEELAERELLEGTLKDGLEPEEWTDDDFIQTRLR